MQVTSTILKISRKSILFISIPLVLSAFTHLWNPVGFPAVYVDEGHYMRRAMQILEGQGPQETRSTYPYDRPYDHPYFGQIFLASIFQLIGYPASLNPTPNGDDAVHSVEMLYTVPRVLMGLLAVVDTFLIYKIAEVRYNNRKVAFIASILFAVMPLSWITRRILLDCIQLPFLLLSILFAVYYVKNSTGNEENNKKNTSLILLSGIFLGLAIFTKIPAFTMIPLVGYIIYAYTNKNGKNDTNRTKRRIRNLKALGLWFIPVILIPLIWPAYSVSIGQFDEWFNGVLWQGSGRGYKSLLDSINSIFQIDSVLIVIGMAGFIYTAIKRDFFFLIWIIPFLLFFNFVGYAQFFHLISLIPAFCLAAAVMIVDLLNRISINKKKVQQIFPIAIISAIAIFGLISTIMLIAMNTNSSFFQAYGLIVKHTSSNNSKNNDPHKIIMIGNRNILPFYFWIPRYAFANDLEFLLIRDVQSLEAEKVIMIIDNSNKKYMFGKFDKENDIFIPANAVDNNSKTRWASNGIGSWIQADLGEKRIICYANISWYKGNTRSYNFVISSVSSDGTNFKNIYAAKSSGLSVSEKYDFSDIATRYIRITVNGNTNSNNAAINDIQLYGYDPDKAMSTSNSCKKLPITVTGITESLGDKRKELLQMLYYNSSMITKLGRTEVRANY